MCELMQTSCVQSGRRVANPKDELSRRSKSVLVGCSSFALAFITLVLLLLIDRPASSSAFPSIFNRTPFAFRRQQQQQAVAARPTGEQPIALTSVQAQLIPIAVSDQQHQHQQHQQQQQQHNHQPLHNQHHAPEVLGISNSGAHQFPFDQMVAAAAALQAAPARVHAQHQPFVPSAAAAANQHQHQHQMQWRPTQTHQTYTSGFYHNKPNMQVHPQLQAQPLLQHDSIEEPQMELIDQSSGGEFGAGSGRRGLQQHGSHTSEIVDKIERHIGQQIEQSLANKADQLGGSYHQTAASGESESEHGGESDSSEGDSAAGAAAAAEGGEKRAAKAPEESSHNKEPSESEHHHEQQQLEHPPEAFEVHHKKGGKSFQYFHQGHEKP